MILLLGVTFVAFPVWLVVAVNFLPGDPPDSDYLKSAALMTLLTAMAASGAMLIRYALT